MAKFIQIIEFDTDKIDEMRKLDEEWSKRASGGPSVHAIQCSDRDNPGHYLAIAMFDSREEAEKNDARPETQEFAGKMQQLAKNVKFHNLDVMYEMD